MSINITGDKRFVGMRVFLLTFVLLGCAIQARSQETQMGPLPTQATQAGGDPIRQLNLTPDQVTKIRAIREQNKDERFMANQRLRQAQRAMDDAINTDNPSEALVEQRARELAEAQTTITRMRALTEVRIRRILTPEQLTKLRMLRQEAMTHRRNQDTQGQLRQEERLQRRQDGLRRNGILRPNPRRRQQGQVPPGQRP